MADDVRKKLTPGTYYAGFHSPFFVTNEMVRSALTPFGVTNVRFFPRSTPPPVDPKKDPKYDDAWDEWLSADYAGPAKDVTVPHFDHVDWLLHVEPSASKPKLPPPQQVVVVSKPSLAPLLLLLLLVWAVRR